MKRYIPLKNYFIAGFTVVLVILLSFYFYRWYTVYQEEQTRQSYLTKTNTVTMQITNINDINTILAEAPSDYVIYISYTRNKDILSLEKKLKKIIDKYGLNDSVYYIDATRHKNDDEYLKKINNNLNINIKYLPTIIYVKNGVIEKDNIIESKKKIFNAEEFENILKNNNVEKLSQ